MTTTVLTALYPVFFAQSSLVHLDLAAAGLTFWGLHSYMKSKDWETALWFSLASLAKETAILAPLALFAWDFCRGAGGAQERKKLATGVSPRFPEPDACFWFHLFRLRAWYAFHYWKTGFVFGNPEFFRYNVEATLQPLRILLALLVRLWQTFGYFHLLLLTLAALFAMWLPPLRDQSGRASAHRLGRAVRHALGDGWRMFSPWRWWAARNWRVTCCRWCRW